MKTYEVLMTNLILDNYLMNIWDCMYVTQFKFKCRRNLVR